MSNQYPNPNQYPAPGQPYSPQQPEPPKQKRKRWPWVLGGVAVVVIAVAANSEDAKEGFQEGYNGTAPTVVDERPTPIAPPPPIEPALPAELPDNGMLKVGADIAPGDYIVTLGDDAFMGDMGYWERLSCTTGDFSCVLSNEIVQGPGYLTVLPTDVAVKVQNVQLQPAG